MGILDFIGESASQFIGNVVKNKSQELIYMAKLEMHRFQKRLIKGIITAFILLMSFALLALALTFYLIDYIHLGRTLSVLIIGIALLIIGIILKL